MVNIVKELSFKKLHEKRKQLIKRYRNQDHIVLEGNNILISAPHGVSQVRLGKHKNSEIGSLATALYLKETTGSSLIVKTKNNDDDANFDINSEYKNSIRKLAKSKKINYILDIHGLAENRQCDVNLGTHLGKNIENNVNLLLELATELKTNGFFVSIDQPFMAGNQTISAQMKKEFPELWSLQIEINCGITNKEENFEKYQKLLFVILKWIKKLK